MTPWRIVGLSAVLSVFASSALGFAPPISHPRGVGVLGDSYSDEYRHYTPDRTQARNWVEFLSEARGFNFGSVSRESLGEPRNLGFAFNWARSAATSTDLVARGQHTGVAAQVAAGEVDLVVLFVGGNDFINALRSSNPVSDGARASERTQANLRIVMETILRAREQMHVIVLTIPDVRELPEIRQAIQSGTISREAVDACGAGLKAYNDAIRALPWREPRVAVVDLELAMRISLVIAPSRLVVGDRAISRIEHGNAPDRFFLADGRHLGTVGQGLIAKLIVDKLNTRFSAGIKPIADEEILEYASRVWAESVSSVRTRSSDSREGHEAQQRSTGR
jgi:lysophospholipase L1-like esterase